MKATKEYINSVADNFGNVYLTGAQITSLPDNLMVGGDLAQ